jgi:hypothetical protein
MQSPFEHNPKPVAAARTPPPSSVERGLERRIQERRNWVTRSFTSLIVFGLVVLSVILVRRDRLARDRYVEALAQYVTALNEKLDKQRREGWNPLMLPAEWDVSHVRPAPPVSLDFYRYCDDTLRQFAQSRNEPTLIAWSEQSIPMTVSSDGRPVAIYEKKEGKVRAEWLAEGEFKHRLDEQQAALDEAIRQAEQRPAKAK